jgi:hypothetical protein
LLKFEWFTNPSTVNSSKHTHKSLNSYTHKELQPQQPQQLRPRNTVKNQQYHFTSRFFIKK